LSSGLSLTLAKIGEIQEVPRQALCDDSHMPRTALVVDDHQSFRRFARRLLEAAGFAVLDEAADGAGAIEAARRLRPDVVLLDVLLPDANGLEVAELLSAESSGPLIVLTSSRSATEFGSSLARSSAHGFIAKSDLTAASVTALVGEPA
jgi:DNA-binding NarL/FixJ family response regulator